MLCGSIEYKLISQNLDKALTGKRVRFSLRRPTLNSLRGCCPSREDRQRFYFMCQVYRILTTSVLFLEVLFWELLTFAGVPYLRSGATSDVQTTRRLRPHIALMHRLEPQSRPTCRSRCERVSVR